MSVRNNKLVQIRSNALSAEYIYSKELTKINRVTTAITCLTIFVPLIVTFALVLAKGSEYESLLNIISFVFLVFCFVFLSGLLFVDMNKKKNLFL